MAEGTGDRAAHSDAMQVDDVAATEGASAEAAASASAAGDQAKAGEGSGVAGGGGAGRPNYRLKFTLEGHEKVCTMLPQGFFRLRGQREVAPAGERVDGPQSQRAECSGSSSPQTLLLLPRRGPTRDSKAHRYIYGRSQCLCGCFSKALVQCLQLEPISRRIAG
jgi:hypothetical protein